MAHVPPNEAQSGVLINGVAFFPKIILVDRLAEIGGSKVIIDQYLQHCDTCSSRIIHGDLYYPWPQIKQLRNTMSQYERPDDSDDIVTSTARK